MIDLHVTTVRLPRCSTLDQKKLPEAASGHPGTCAQPNAHRRLIALTVLSAIWPWGSIEDHEHPSCMKKDVLLTRGGYWFMQGGQPVRGRPKPPEDEAKS